MWVDEEDREARPASDVDCRRGSAGASATRSAGGPPRARPSRPPRFAPSPPGRRPRTRPGPPPRGRRRSPTRAAPPPGRSSSRSGAARAIRTEAIRFARTTSWAVSPDGRLPSRAVIRPARPLRAALASGRLDRDRVGVDAQDGAAHPASRRRSPGCRSRNRRPGPGRRRRGRDRRPLRSRPDTAASSGGGRSRTPSPGRDRARRRRGRLVVAPGRPDDDPAPDPHHREVRLPRLGPVGLVDDPRRQLADRAKSERLEMAERLGGLGGGPLRRRRIAGRDVRPDGRRPGRVDPRAEALLDELERRLDARSAGSDPTEDLGDGLDGFDVDLDRQLQPGAGPGRRAHRDLGPGIALSQGRRGPCR